MDSAVYRGQGDIEVEIDIEVVGELEPYFGGSWDEPPSGGGVVDVTAWVTTEPVRHEIQLTEDEVRDLSGQLAEHSMDDEPPEPEEP